VRGVRGVREVRVPDGVHPDAARLARSLDWASLQLSATTVVLRAHS